MPPANERPTDLTDTWGRKNRRLLDRACAHCGNVFRPKRAASAYCSVPCARTKNGGHNKKAESWWTDAKGYIQGRVLENGRRVRVRAHRKIAEDHIGRQLLPDEDVHHKDGCKTNNSLDNLEVIPHGEHTRLSNSERTYQRGYRLNLSDAERAARADRMRAMRRAAVLKAQGAGHE